ncbi:HNH endonuclease [Miniphocaeibacter massiliensis]|uniref:HNH endonuclease n=1 Tax=Miniphocaeibacter massiliensis TaxID=2041841 RepID=UPI000C1C13FF|nr:HNH endonuclease signature motif containing protein [Miniphocaeibacter massiliensis]
MNSKTFTKIDYGIYYFANIIDTILEDDFPYLRNLNDLFGESQIQYYIKPFQKHSAFHEFISFTVDSIFNEYSDRFDYVHTHKESHLKHWFDRYNIPTKNIYLWLNSKNKNLEYLTEIDVDDYYQDLLSSSEYYFLLEKITGEIFFLLFSNRKILQRFNILLSSYLELLDGSDIDKENIKYVQGNSRLHRQTIPVWVKNAVFFRDRGRCVFCNKDLSNLITNQNRINYDHIVPLNLYGLNDITNIQLSCQECNNSKRAKNCSTNNIYEKWY